MSYSFLKCIWSISLPFELCHMPDTICINYKQREAKNTFFVCLSATSWRHMGGVAALLHSFLTWSSPRFTSWKELPARRSMGPTNGLYMVVKRKLCRSRESNAGFHHLVGSYTGWFVLTHKHKVVYVCVIIEASWWYCSELHFSVSLNGEDWELLSQLIS